MTATATKRGRLSYVTKSPADTNETAGGEAISPLSPALAAFFDDCHYWANVAREKRRAKEREREERERENEGKALQC